MDGSNPGTTRPARLLILLALSLTLLANGAEPPGVEPAWAAALRQMPLPPDTQPLNRENLIPVFLTSFRSNHVFRAMVILPAVADDLYLFSRDQPKLDIRATNLLEAIRSVTNQTSLRFAIRPPFLLVYLDRDLLLSTNFIRDPKVADRLTREQRWPEVRLVDRHWDAVQPELERRLGVRIFPEARSQAAWHFARHNLTGWHLTDSELLEAIALTGGTRYVWEEDRLIFERR